MSLKNLSDWTERQRALETLSDGILHVCNQCVCESRPRYQLSMNRISQPEKIQIVCDNCGIAGPRYDNFPHAEDMWNTMISALDFSWSEEIGEYDDASMFDLLPQNHHKNN